MKINTQKILKEIGRLDLSLDELGKRIDPPMSKWALWYLIHNGKTLNRIERIAKALELDPKDLII
uniref:Uncharacterized protein n=1 Tax=viral metagenome TaxID=1070528 RepID=A0A6H2A0Z7_9ZZZZ